MGHKQNLPQAQNFYKPYDIYLKIHTLRAKAKFPHPSSLKNSLITQFH